MSRRSIAWVMTLWVAVSGCDTNAQPKGETPPRPVVTFEVEAPQSTLKRSFSGKTAAADSAELGFDVPGRITRILAVEGRRYEAGDTLAQLDVSNYVSELQQTEAEATRATEDLRRVQQLFESNNSSRSQFDSALATQKAAAAALTAAKKKVSDGTLIMPYAGIIGEVLKEPQEFVSAGSAVFRIQGEGGMEFRVGIPGELIGLVSIGQKGAVVLGSMPTEQFEGTVSQVSPQVSQNTTYPVVLVIHGQDVNLRDGMDGEATFVLPNPRGAVLTVPIESVVGSPGDTTFVWLVTAMQQGKFGLEGTLQRREVTCGSLRASGRIEVLAGLNVGDQVVTRGVHQVSEGLVARLSTGSESSTSP